ncbi:hypothetical protein SAMN05192575_101675 [Nocardioides alpinus]|uniref:Glycosyl transferases group 1 n=1 Tax=Nocardioides alpinus TaxID=748909 RepID=A0A1I0W3U4_9ACTN|nr:glycosyltransferase family 1 protein [Nocardioides alpinus]SFA83224.1 hypothetical protein SAMN05192575_101675 [Nocardioides alpinus]
MSHRTRVIYTDPGGRGWATVELLAQLLAEMVDAELVTVPTRPRLDRARRATGSLPRRRSSGTCIVIAPQPAHLGSLLRADYLLRGYDRVVGWVIDSFLDDRIPRMAQHRGHYDQLFITDAELVGTWAERTGAETGWLPFGSNVLDQPDLPRERPLDLLRVGRQPPEWEDNKVTAAAASRLGLTFSGGPPLDPDPRLNQAALTTAMRSTKLTLSFTNLVSPAVYTHPTRDYVTGRWTDALGSGAAVAGIAPRCEAGQRLLFDEGLVLLPDTTLDAGLTAVAEAVAAWTPARADAIHLRALRTLDWRLRFAELAASVGLSSARLDDELARWEARIDTLAARPA